MRRVLLAVIALSLVVAPILSLGAVPAMAQDATSNTTATSSEYALSDLQQGGTTHAGAPPSMRFMGSYGSATLRHEPVGLGSEDWEYVDSGASLVKRNEVTLKTIRLGDPAEDLTVHVVAWNRETKTVQTENGTTTEPVAANVTEREVQVSLGRGYDNASVPLPANFGGRQQITMWIEEYPDARWHFEHRSVATTRPISINSWGDFLNALFWRIGVFALPAMVVGWGLAKRHRETAIVGPQWGAVKWIGAFAVPITLLASVWAFQGAVLAVRAPAAIGLLFGPLTYALTLEAGNDKLEQFLFRHQDLEHAKSPRGDEAFDSRYVTHTVKHGVRRESAGELVLIEKGLMPYIARLRGNLAVLDITDVETHKEGRGPYALEIELDPDWKPDDALVHDPPRVARRSLMKRADVPLLGATEIPNPAVVLPIALCVGAGYYVADATLGIPGVGAATGFVVALPFIHYVEEGGADAEPAPYHFTQAEASLAHETAEYADAKLLEEFRDIAWQERMKTPLEARELVEQFDQTVTSQLNATELGDLGLDDVFDDGERDRTDSVNGGVASGDD
ncbi:hypothetical protein ACOZ4L_02730 [Haloplanus ruber]|uniref:DUF2207 domain-containing protein n=1 Tax=Haloplanus ruber TaxID=869892 RepID=A0ABD6D229_9EURY|nr:hypothetical protein [Haloplanus ruber]